jgi:hypothetical protein
MRFKHILYLLVVLVFVGSVSSQSATAPNTAAQPGFFDQLNNILNGTGSISDFLISQLLPKLVGGIFTFAFIIILQKLGIDVIGFFFSTLFFVFDFFFTILRFALASEANLMAFVIIFLAIWLAFLFL